MLASCFHGREEALEVSVRIRDAMRKKDGVVALELVQVDCEGENVVRPVFLFPLPLCLSPSLSLSLSFGLNLSPYPLLIPFEALIVAYVLTASLPSPSTRVSLLRGV